MRPLCVALFAVFLVILANGLAAQIPNTPARTQVNPNLNSERDPYALLDSRPGRRRLFGSRRSRDRSGLRLIPGSSNALITDRRLVSDAHPNLIGDLFGGGMQTVTVRNTVSQSFHVTGTLLSGSINGPALIGFEADGIGPGNDFFTISTSGQDSAGADGFQDTFVISEPLPPNEVPTTPGGEFAFDGGTVVYTRDASATTAQPGEFSADGDIWFASYSFSETQTLLLPPAGGISLRRVKLAENNSPIPRDRYFFDYRFFNDVTNGIGDINRYTFGLERTLFSGETSVEARIPFAATIDANQILGTPISKDFEVGNLTFALKQVLWESNWTLHTMGIGVSIPTGDDTRLRRSDGVPILHVQNESVRLLPFLGSLWLPSERSYLQAFVQLDIDTNGNPVFGNGSGGSLQRIGSLQDPTLLNADLSGGHWLYRDFDRSVCLNGLAMIAELHYSTTLQDADVVSGNGITITDTSNRLDVLNGTVGMHLLFQDGLTATTGFSFPFRSGDDQQFDYEIGVLFNRFF